MTRYRIGDVIRFTGAGLDARDPTPGAVGVCAPIAGGRGPHPDPFGRMVYAIWSDGSETSVWVRATEPLGKVKIPKLESFKGTHGQQMSAWVSAIREAAIIAGKKFGGARAPAPAADQGYDARARRIEGARDAEWENTDDLTDMQCPMCGDGDANPLGRLGNLVHYRCRQCGADFNRKAVTVNPVNQWGREDYSGEYVSVSHADFRRLTKGARATHSQLRPGQTLYIRSSGGTDDMVGIATTVAGTPTEYYIRKGLVKGAKPNPAGKREVLRLVSSKGKVELVGYLHDDGSYSYDGDGSCGWGDSEQLLRKAAVVRLDRPSVKATGDMAEEFWKAVATRKDWPFNAAAPLRASDIVSNPGWKLIDRGHISTTWDAGSDGKGGRVIVIGGYGLRTPIKPGEKLSYTVEAHGRQYICDGRAEAERAVAAAKRGTAPHPYNRGEGVCGACGASGAEHTGGNVWTCKACLDEGCGGAHPAPACGYDCPKFCAGRGGGGKDCGCSICDPDVKGNPAPRSFRVGDKVRWTGEYLRNTGQPTGPEGLTTWKVVGLGKIGSINVAHLEAGYGRNTEKRTTNVENLEIDYRQNPLTPGTRPWQRRHGFGGTSPGAKALKAAVQRGDELISYVVLTAPEKGDWKLTWHVGTGNTKTDLVIGEAVPPKPADEYMAEHGADKAVEFVRQAMKPQEYTDGTSGDGHLYGIVVWHGKPKFYLMMKNPETYRDHLVSPVAGRIPYTATRAGHPHIVEKLVPINRGRKAPRWIK